MNPSVVCLIVFVGLACLGSAEGQKCPPKCICFKTTVRCMLLHIERVPQIPKDTTMLFTGNLGRKAYSRRNFMRKMADRDLLRSMH